MNHQSLTLSQLQTLIKGELERALPLSYWVVGEVSELKVNYSGHCYMQLVEKSATGQQVQAAASAVAWRSSWGSISSYFQAETGGNITAGMKLLLKVSVNYHPLYGLSLVISDIDPAYTLGDVERERQATILKLQQDGVFDMNRELSVPAFVQRIAVVSSRNAAGYQDFMKELDRSDYRFEMTLFDAFMQGEAAEASIISALDSIAESADDFDAVVIIRGGGSQSDLACFNAYRLCSHIAQFPLPVITGIGHDKDRSVTDMVAAVELKTPTAVAVYLVEMIDTEYDMLCSMSDRVNQFATAELDRSRNSIKDYSSALMRVASDMSHMLERRFDELQSRIMHKSETVVSARQRTLTTTNERLQERSLRILTHQDSNLKIISQRIESRNPARLMALGWAVVKSNDRLVRDASVLSPGDNIELSMLNGTVTAEVKTIEQ